jgi:tetratricopeptide (TPR) repeat protein
MKRVCSFVLAAAIALGSCLLIAPMTVMAKKGDKHFKQGLLYVATQHWARAAEEFSRAVLADPSNLEYQLNFRRASFNASKFYTHQGRALVEQGDYAGAYNAFRQACAFDPINEVAVSEMRRLQKLEGTNGSGDGVTKSVEDSGPQSAAEVHEATLHHVRTEPHDRVETLSKGNSLANDLVQNSGSQSAAQAQKPKAPRPKGEALRALKDVKEETNASPNRKGLAKTEELKNSESQLPQAQQTPLPPPQTEQVPVSYSDDRSSKRAKDGGVTLSGTAEDEMGAVIPGEKITLIAKTTGETRETVSDNAGNFTFSNVIPGEYVLKGVAEGFEPTELKITVGPDPAPALRIKMAISISEDVTIFASPTSHEGNADAVTFSDSMVSYLPTESQNILAVLNNFLSPAAVGVNGPSIIVDGVEGSDLNIPTEAIKDVVINKNPYSPDYRRPGLARIEVITRDGSSKHYQGTSAFYLRNGNWNARNPFAAQKSDLDMRLFEARIGGPLPFFDKTKFFLSGTRLMDDKSVLINALTPSGPLVENVPTFKRSTKLLARIDFKPNKLNRTILTYKFHDQPERNVGIGGLQLAEQGMSVVSREHKFQLSNTTAFSSDFLNTFRFAFEREKERVGFLPDNPAIEVKGAFTGGPSQTAISERETQLEFQDLVVYGYGKQTFRFGGAFRPRFFTSSDATNFGGTFTFADLTNFAAGTPILFRIVQGNPKVSFSQPDAYGFFQDEIRLRKDLNVMLGLRYEWQAKLGDHNNFAPRLALAFAPGDQKTVFRAGAGIFYDRLSDTAVARSLLLDGVQTRELVIERPFFPDPFKEGDSSLTRPSIWRLAPDISAPYLFQSTLGVERNLNTATQLAVEYQMLRGVHLFRTRNINAPLGSSGILPNSNFGLINQIESSASLRSNALIVTLQGEFIDRFKGMAQYTLSRTTDDTNGTFELPANNYDVRSELGRSNFDKRHRFNFAGRYSFPGEIKIAAVLSLATGAPFDITTGFDDNSDGVVNDRPLGVFRNSGKGPGFAQLDLRFLKSFTLPTFFHKELKPGKEFDDNLVLSLDVFNVPNRNNLSNVIGILSSPRFGRANSSLQARTFQLSLKYEF